MTPARRRQLARIGAPAAFLLAVTIAVLLVRASVSDEDAAAPTTETVRIRTTTRPNEIELRPLAPARQTETTPSAESYVIESGDTLETIAAERDTTVERLLELNPGIDPVSLRVGQRIRVPAE